MKARVLVPLAAFVLGLGVLVWWQQGGFGGPVSDGAARRYFSQIVAAAEAKDFAALCRLNASVGTCEFELRGVCPDPATGGPLSPSRQDLDRECGESVPDGPPEIVASREHPAKDGHVGGRILVVRGTDGRHKPYETEVLVFRDKRSYKATHAVFWSGSKFVNETTP